MAVYRSRQLDLTRAENHRIKEALRTWQTRHAEERSRARRAAH